MLASKRIRHAIDSTLLAAVRDKRKIKEPPPPALDADTALPDAVAAPFVTLVPYLSVVSAPLPAARHPAGHTLDQVYWRLRHAATPQREFDG